jgi:hypothetical protein
MRGISLLGGIYHIRDGDAVCVDVEDVDALAATVDGDC